MNQIQFTPNDWAVISAAKQAFPSQKTSAMRSHITGLVKRHNDIHAKRVLAKIAQFSDENLKAMLPAWFK